MIIDFDDTDREIMIILQKNSRIANTEIAKRLHISEATVRNRIRRLVDGKIIQNMAVINPELLGYQMHLFVGVQVELNKAKDVASKLKDKDVVHFLGYSTGRYDLIFVAFFRNADEQRQFFLEELSCIQGIIRTETFNVLKNVKTKYLWGVSVPAPRRAGNARKGH